MHAEDLIRHGDHPVDERRLLQICDTIKPGGDPVFRDHHVTGDLCLDCVHVIHETRRACDVDEECEGGYENYNPAPSRTSTIGIVNRASSAANSIFHRFIHTNKTIRPHK